MKLASLFQENLHFFPLVYSVIICFISTTSMILYSEAVAKTGMVMVVGEVTSHATVDYQKVIRDTIQHIGYDDSSKGKFYRALLYVCLNDYIWTHII